MSFIHATPVNKTPGPILLGLMAPCGKKCGREGNDQDGSRKQITCVSICRILERIGGGGRLGVKDNPNPPLLAAPMNTSQAAINAAQNGTAFGTP